MAVPKKKTTKSKRNMRRMHIFLNEPPLATCPQCKEKKIMHAVCKACGYYKNREVINVLKKEEKKSKKSKESKPEEEKENKSLEMGEMSKRK